jgi:hypothetical protein
VVHTLGVPDSWRCECGYTNIGAKTCIVCRRPRQAVSVAEPPAPLPDEEESAPVPVKAKPTRKATKKRA